MEWPFLSLASLGWPDLCFPSLWSQGWTFLLATLYPHKHSSCIVLRQNIYTERSPNTARLRGGKSEILHQGSLMAWTDSEPCQSCILTLWNSECLKKTVQRKLGEIWICKYTHICWYLKQPGVCTDNGKSIIYSSKKCYFSRDSTTLGHLEFRYLYSHLSFACAFRVT